MIDDYDSIYASSFKLGKNYTKLSSTSEDPLAQFPRYNADEVDEAFVASLKKSLSVSKSFDVTLFEWIIDCLEEAAHRLSESVISSECVERLRDRYGSALPGEETINRIIDFWKERRATQRLGIPFLKHDDIGKIGADPYVCFRRRELKLPRKTRRSDAQTTERLKKLHLDLSSMKLMLHAAIKRDRHKREALVLEGELFEKYRLVDNWRRHNKTSWPPHLATFKIAAQSLMEAKKKKGGREQEEEEGHEGGAHAAGPGYKIAIPISALKHSRFVRPYYSHELGKLIQRDLDALLGHRPTPQVEAQLLGEICNESEEATGEQFWPSPSLGGAPASYRRGRGGRLILDRTPARRYTVSRPLQDLPTAHAIKFHCTIPPAKEFAALQAQVGNYNLHAVNIANQILRPMSFVAWTAATAPIVAALTGTKASKSPKKKRRIEDESPATSPSVPEPRPEQPSVEITKLGSNSQITVKVKSHPKEPQRRVSGSARFTPHGLAPDSIPASAASSADSSLK